MVKNEIRKMTITVTNPTDQDTVTRCYNVAFHKNEDDYGNGYHVSIWCDATGFDEYYDIRYDTSFCETKKDEWMKKWAEKRWSGKNHSWKLTSVEISVVIGKWEY